MAGAHLRSSLQGGRVMPSLREGRIEVTRKDTIYRGSFLAKEDTVIVRFGNARKSTRLDGSEPQPIAEKILGELVDKAIGGKKPKRLKKA